MQRSSGFLWKTKFGPGVRTYSSLDALNIPSGMQDSNGCEKSRVFFARMSPNWMQFTCTERVGTPCLASILGLMSIIVLKTISLHGLYAKRGHLGGEWTHAAPDLMKQKRREASHGTEPRFLTWSFAPLTGRRHPFQGPGVAWGIPAFMALRHPTTFRWQFRFLCR